LSTVSKKSNGFSVKAYRGDAKTLLAFNLVKSKTTRLAGFTIQVAPPGVKPYYIYNNLQFEFPEKHAQVATEKARSSVNAPIHKFRWVHIPGTNHQGTKPKFGKYKYTVTPRYFDDNKSLLPIDAALGVSVSIEVSPFEDGRLALGFTRGYVQSQGYVNHFGPKAKIQPAKAPLGFDIKLKAGTDPSGKAFTYEDEYRWLGFTARERILEMLDEVIADKKLRLDVFAYDLSASEVVNSLLKLAKQGRVRILLDNSASHSSKSEPKIEDAFQKAFEKQDKAPAAIARGKFGRYAHDKVFIVSDSQGPKKVLTGSTNFSVTGLYVNSNHVLVFADRAVAKKYQDVFDAAWATKASKAKFVASPLSSNAFSFDSAVPRTDITFAPHEPKKAASILGDLTKRIAAEEKKPSGCVLFAVMQVDNGISPVWKALTQLHAREKIFSFGISDTTKGISLYKPGRKTGVLATGKPGKTTLPKPFNQVPSLSAHQIHHKFVVCGLERPDSVVYCGSSNLAQGGEENNGDNLLAIHDPDVATVFAIEAVTLVDHFNFLDAFPTGKRPKTPAASPSNAAEEAGWFLSTTDHWSKKFFDPKDLKCMDRELFA